MKWQWTSDTIVFDYNSVRTGKDHHLTIITPQAYLINSLACYAIKYEEKKNVTIHILIINIYIYILTFFFYYFKNNYYILFLSAYYRYAKRKI